MVDGGEGGEAVEEEAAEVGSVEVGLVKQEEEDEACEKQGSRGGGRAEPVEVQSSLLIPIAPRTPRQMLAGMLGG